ncbi:MAG TPA: GNAT family N-acetyltransferase [Thermoplasmata archaeon]|nr:GNAT family N-acetyltransferase [Thermoplasmata archaeon]
MSRDRDPRRVRIRPATNQDATAISGIYNQSVVSSVATFDTEPRTPEGQTDRLRHHGARHPFLVAEEEGVVVGWASLSPWSDRKAYDDTAEISIYVDRDHQGRGVGRRLMSEILEGARRARLHTVLARIAEGSEASLRLHRSSGFREIGRMREVGWKFGRRVDVWLLQFFPGSPPAPDSGSHTTE